MFGWFRVNQSNQSFQIRLGGTDTPIVAISLYYQTLINVQGKSTQRGDEMFRGKTPTHEIIRNGGPPRKEHWVSLNLQWTCTLRISLKTSGDIQSIILWGTSILENSIHLPCNQYWWGCIVYRIHKLPYLEVNIPYKTRTTHLYSLLFFRNENLIQDDFPNGDWWPDFFLGSRGYQCQLAPQSMATWLAKRTDFGSRNQIHTT